jgi:DNA-binding XRE family transcriptional regulator
VGSFLTYKGGIFMWKDNLIELKEQSGKTTKDIADGVKVSESTIKRVFSRKKEDNKRGHSLDLIISIIHYLGGSFSKIFEDTGAIVSNAPIAALQEQVESLTAARDALRAECDLLTAENAINKTEIQTLTAKIDILTMQLNHKDEMIALYKLLHAKG